MNTNANNEQTVRLIARQLSKAYGFYFEKRMRRPYRPNPRASSQESWQRVARTCIRLGADPQHYMAAQFEFAKSLPIPNTLHADKAVKNYVRYQVTALYVDSDNSSGIDTGARMSPGVTLIKTKIADTAMHLQSLSGITDVTSIEAEEFIVKNPWHFDSLSVMLTCPTDKIADIFGAQAATELKSRPEIEQALREDETMHHILRKIHACSENNAG